MKMSKSKETEYYMYEEINDWEGETWYVFIPTDMEGIKELKSTLKIFNKEYPNEEPIYILDTDTIHTQAEVDTYMEEESETTYLNENNICEKIDIETLKEVKTYDDILDCMNKLQIFTI